MNWPGDAQTWMDVVDHGLVALAAVLVAAIPSWFAARNHKVMRSVDRKTDAIVGNVQNGHPEPLRADIDRLASAFERIEGKIDRLESQMVEAREDGAAEKTLRRAENRELREDMDARFRALNQRMD